MQGSIYTGSGSDLTDEGVLEASFVFLEVFKLLAEHSAPFLGKTLFSNSLIFVSNVLLGFLGGGPLGNGCFKAFFRVSVKLVNSVEPSLAPDLFSSIGLCNFDVLSPVLRNAGLLLILALFISSVCRESLLSLFEFTLRNILVCTESLLQVASIKLIEVLER